MHHASEYAQREDLHLPVVLVCWGGYTSGSQYNYVDSASLSTETTCEGVDPLPKNCGGLRSGYAGTLKRFESTCLRPDGTFLLYMMRLNAGDIITNELIQALFERYIRHEKLAAASPIKEGVSASVSSPNPSVDAKGDAGSILKQRFV